MNLFCPSTHTDALHQGAFVWADSQNAAFSSTTNDQFFVLALEWGIQNPAN